MRITGITTRRVSTHEIRSGREVGRRVLIRLVVFSRSTGAWPSVIDEFYSSQKAKKAAGSMDTST